MLMDLLRPFVLFGVKFGTMALKLASGRENA